jgi:hypothetical protein
LLVALADVFAPEVYDPEYAARLKRLRARHAERPDRPMLVVLGSSRTISLFRAESLPPLTTPDGREVLSFNFSRSGGGPVYSRFAYQRLRRQNLTPAWIVVELMPLLFLHDTERYFYYFVTADELGDLRRYTSDRRAIGCYAKYRYLPWRSNRAGLLRAFAPAWSLPFDGVDPESLDRLGGARPPNVIADDARRAADARVAANLANLTQGYRIGPGSEQAFRDLLHDCRSAGTRVVVVRTPESSALRAAYPPESRAALAEYQDRLRREFGVILVDATAWLPDTQFVDGHHSLAGGQAIFTERLHREVLVPLVAGKYNPPHPGIAAR